MNDRERIGYQLWRLAVTGFIRKPGVEGQAEYIAALARLDPALLELAVSRWIETSTSRFFPFPGELRALVQGELSQRAPQLDDWRPTRIEGHHDGCSCGHCSYFFPRRRALTVIEGGR